MCSSMRSTSVRHALSGSIRFSALVTRLTLVLTSNFKPASCSGVLANGSKDAREMEAQ